MARVMRSHFGREQPPSFPLPRSMTHCHFLRPRSLGRGHLGGTRSLEGRVLIGFLLLAPTPQHSALPYGVITELRHGGVDIDSEMIPRL